ncbi:MAG: ABC transporter ATP-binding protein, partial [Candidatus Avoscillospira sp.]
MPDQIEISHLSKRFGDVQAVQDLSFRVKEGELFAFLGINGAGKSTTINILCGQLAKDAGTVRIDGVDLDSDPDRIKRSLGVVFQNSVLDKDLSVQDNLQSRAALYGLRGKAFRARLTELAGLLEFDDLLKRTVGKLSGGQRRRIDIARALLHRPKILILDEPTTGLDPQTRSTLWKVVGDLRKNEGMTVFLTTHYMEEAADADYVVIL